MRVMAKQPTTGTSTPSNRLHILRVGRVGYKVITYPFAASSMRLQN